MLDVLTQIIENMNKVSDFTTEADLKFYIAKELEKEYGKIILEKKIGNDRHHVDIFVESENACLEFKFNKKEQYGYTDARGTFLDDIAYLSDLKEDCCCYAIFITDINATYDKANKDDKLKNNFKELNLEWKQIPTSDYYYTIKQI